MVRSSEQYFHTRTVMVEGVQTTYRVYEPEPSAALAQPLPVILFLHGAGESGIDGLAQTKVGLGPAIVRDPDRFPALVVFPQASRGYGWSGFNLDAAVAALDEVESESDTDRRRVYVTGISMGGYGTWAAVLQQPDWFAAAVPVCGGLDARTAVQSQVIQVAPREQLYEQAARRLARVPHWIFHGDADNIIPVTESREMVRALRAAGADVRYTEYAGVRHNSWDRAYAEPELLPWMLRQRS
jgi:predicted peptidase